MCFVPLPERSGVDLDDGGFGEGVGADEFVVGGVEGYDDNADFASDAFRAPGEIAGIKAKGAILGVTAANTD